MMIILKIYVNIINKCCIMCNFDLKKNILNVVVVNICFYLLCVNSFIDCMFCLVFF